MSSAAKVEIYISKRPYIKEALSQGIINYSALARKICQEEELNSVDAVKAALSRYEDFISEERQNKRSQVEEILDSTSLEIKSGVKVIKKHSEDSIVSADTQNGYTSVVEDGNKALISLESPVDLETTPGVLEFILSSLAAEGINIDHFISCREDTHLIIDDDDASESLKILQNRLS